MCSRGGVFFLSLVGWLFRFFRLGRVWVVFGCCGYWLLFLFLSSGWVPIYRGSGQERSGLLLPLRRRVYLLLFALVLEIYVLTRVYSSFCVVVSSILYALFPGFMLFLWITCLTRCFAL